MIELIIEIHNTENDEIGVVTEEIDGEYFFQTKGDNNLASGSIDMNIDEERVIGKAVIKVPFLGYIKIWAFEVFKLM